MFIDVLIVVFVMGFINVVIYMIDDLGMLIMILFGNSGKIDFYWLGYNVGSD